MRYVYRLAVLLLVLSVACRSPVGFRHHGTLLVSNATCVLGRCASVEVDVYPQNQPGTPGGFWRISLGTVTGSSACLYFDPADTFLVIGPTDTTKFVWTPGDSAEMGGLMAGADPFMALPSTAEFVPTSAPGWSVSLPGDTLAHPSQPCTS